MQKRIDDLTKENEKYRKSKTEAVATEKKAKETALAEQGKYKELYETTLKDVETSKKNLSNVEKKNALRLALTEAGAKHPELLEGLFKDGDNWSFELDESGKIAGSDGLMNPIKESYKSLFTETTLVGDGAPKVNHSNINTNDFYSQKQMDAMSDAELVANYDKVEKSIRALTNN